jgi:hypothetical protein
MAVHTEPLHSLRISPRGIRGASSGRRGPASLALNALGALVAGATMGLLIASGWPVSPAATMLLGVSGLMLATLRLEISKPGSAEAAEAA